MSVSFSVAHDYDGKFPTCDHMHFSGEYDFVDIRLDDKKRIKQYTDNKRYYGHKVNSGLHYFDEVGFLQCKICGWTP